MPDERQILSVLRVSPQKGEIRFLTITRRLQGEKIMQALRTDRLRKRNPDGTGTGLQGHAVHTSSVGLYKRSFLTAAGAVATMLCMSLQAVAQSDVALATRTTKLQALSEALKKRDETDRAQAQAWANRAGIPLRRELPNGRLLELQRIPPGVGPVFYITNNLDAADTVSTDDIWPGGPAGLALDGTGMTLGEWDGGAVGLHPDFDSRLTQVDGATAFSNHSTHVAGTLVGSGEGLYAARGMAYKAALNAYDWNSDTAEMAGAAGAGLLLSNHSYGIAAGWIDTGGEWWWIGGESSNEDVNFGYYDSETRLWDQIAFDAPYYLIVKAAGNDRWDIGPQNGEEYTIVDQAGNPITTSNAPRPPDCAPAGYDCLPTTSVAKNILTVGAVDDIPGGYSPLAGPAQVQMAGFSSWGPTDDGRIKPDVVGNGVLVLSTVAYNPYYAESLGTSMAAPNVTGSLLLLQEHYQSMHGTGTFMRAATLKALAIHTADEAGDAAGPDYEFGWGLLNTEAAAEVISEDGNGLHQIIEGILAPGETDTYQVTVTESSTTVTATLAWTDPPGTPVSPVLDPPDRMLVNDLDLRISNGIYSYLPWVLDPASPAAPATKGDNVRDNVEQVVISAAEAGTYTVRVSHKGALLNNADQHYSLIFSVEPALPPTSGLVIDEDFSGGLPAGWSVETVRGIDWEIRSPQQGDYRYANNTGGSGNFAMVDNQTSEGFIFRTLTSLVSPSVDLSGADGAVLGFKSCFQFEYLETINVDVSTDGGLSWTNVWSRVGDICYLPSRPVLDLSGVIAGSANVSLRFRFDTADLRQGNFWQIDDIELEAIGGSAPPPQGGELPGQATNPAPADASGGAGLETDISWSAGSVASSHDVYFGTSSMLDAGDSQGNQNETTFDPGTLDHATTYYWRIDEVNGEGVTQGNTWRFTTEAAAAETMHIAALSGIVIPDSRGRWIASVEVAVHDQGGNPEPGVTVDGTWSNGANGAGACTTEGNGRCSIEKGNLKQQVTSVTFTVEALTKSGMDYDPGDDIGSSSVTVPEAATNQLPNAMDDSYTTQVDTPLTGNVLDNDEPGDTPATVGLLAPVANGSLTLNQDGGFTYTPQSGFEGSDGFSYTITDSSDETSNPATVTIEVTAVPTPPPPPPSGGLTVTAEPYKDKGIQHVTLTWQGFTGDPVDIFRNGEVIASATDENPYDDNLDTKGGGQTYNYSVCELGTNNCAEASASF